MKAFISLALLAVIGAVSAGHLVHDLYAYPKYTYNYGVADKLTGDQKSAGEARDGHLTKGYYQLVQPDGVLRTVHYVSTPKGGFQAQVVNKGIAGHPAIYGFGKGIGIGGIRGGIGGYGRGVGGVIG